MSLIKTSFMNAFAVVVKLISSLILNKILAVYVGPAGYAATGQFQNAVSIVTSLAGGVLANGVTKATAQHFDDEAKQHAVWKTAIQFSLIASLVTGISLLFIGDWLSEWLLHRTDISSLFIWLALALPAMAANNLLIAIINGKKEVGVLVAANIIGSISNILVTGLLTISFGLIGALAAFTINPAVALFSTAILATRFQWFKVGNLWGGVDRLALRELSGFGLMGLTSALTLPVSYMLVRDHLAKEFGLPAAGYWQASWGISGIYLMLVTTTLSVYYLPRLAEIRTSQELKVELIKVYSFVLPIVVLGAVTIFILRDFIIHALFTQDFLPMRELFSWQLMGDVVKIGSWILGYVLVGRAMVGFFVITEIVFSALFVLMTWFFVDLYGLVGVSMAYAANYCFHWICMAYIVIGEMQKMKIEHD